MTLKILCFQYPPFMHIETSQILFSAINVDIEWDMLPSNSNFEVVKLRINNTHIALGKFDIATLVSLDTTRLFSIDVVQGMKDLVRDASQIHGKKIMLLGVVFDLPDPYYSQQLALFDGWFIGKSNSKEQLKRIVSEYFNT